MPGNIFLVWRLYVSLFSSYVCHNICDSQRYKSANYNVSPFRWISAILCLTPNLLGVRHSFALNHRFETGKIKKYVEQVNVGTVSQIMSANNMSLCCNMDLVNVQSTLLSNVLWLKERVYHEDLQRKYMYFIMRQLTQHL